MSDVVDMGESKQNIIKYTNNTNIYTEHLDLSSLKSVRQFAYKILRSEERLDILINNAGIGVSGENRTEDGLHPVMQINFFGHFLLTHLLIGKYFRKNDTLSTDSFSRSSKEISSKQNNLDKFLSGFY